MARDDSKEHPPPNSAVTDQTGALGSSVADALDRAKKIVRIRQRRENALGADLFADPAWDILLDLFIQRVEGRATSSTSASIASRAPMTTALRYIAVLRQRGLVIKQSADHDHRIHYVGLSDVAYGRMIDLLTE